MNTDTPPTEDTQSADQPARTTLTEFVDPELQKWLKTILRTCIVTVGFFKTNGDKRIIRCTLDPSVLPPTDPDKVSAPRRAPTESPTAVRVFDVESQEWRSFRWNSIYSIQFEV